MKPQYIFIHHSLTKDGKTVSWSAIREYHIVDLGWNAIGYHYGIELVNKSFEIFKGRMDNEPGAHCKQSGMNRKSLGICLVGNFDLRPPDTTQIHMLTRLTRSLMYIHNIPIEHVMPHNMLAHYKTCPGSQFDFERFTDGLKNGDV